ncbi:3-methyl-2-oxobutanoate dehydrogenase subunit VorB [Geotoga petraea]|jgi:2-oxoglutarate ferredoxin oxidoreductase subunit alpha|uniref:2-oxoglutarate ferredoxin oxidoreductase subunit alpha n=1 Tax=Geotoga petraea TaxID=28234 RepID=A0A1G6HUF7_9BACT|nr:3-methyl-2-oxobutanoate dehydrogenase subunit VorB [Geotoga petraea]MDK2946522.1 2-oxoglutarate/2-oxoacid ferredoxin oxidoreductase subunit alpha [Geotoga sp.]SDB97872.1 2-oxoglutarate ferredoxin oxidoreductase subunit alpha [Geotoga petraea]
MAEKVMVKGTEAIAEAALRAGCRLYYGYPITPQSELTEYMARRMPEIDGTFLQAESEVAAVNMIYGAACTGKRVMTSTSSPGFSLMQEGISYIAGAELPSVFVNVVRGGPGLGDIQPAQGDYFQATKGGGHGDYKLIVYGPESLQEAVELTGKSFDVADKYRTPVLILADGMLGQMMEPVSFPDFVDEKELPDHSDWAMTGTKMERDAHRVTSFNIDPYGLEEMNKRYQARYKEIIKNEKMYEEYMLEDADVVIVAYGTIGRIAKSVAKMAREKGVKAGVFRPITLWPFPYEELAKYNDQAKLFFTVEMSAGQMIEDVKLSVNGKKPVGFYGRMGGVVPTPGEIFAKLMELV